MGLILRILMEFQVDLRTKTRHNWTTKSWPLGSGKPPGAKAFPQPLSQGPPLSSCFVICSRPTPFPLVSHIWPQCPPRTIPSSPTTKFPLILMKIWERENLANLFILRLYTQITNFSSILWVGYL